MKKKFTILEVVDESDDHILQFKVYNTLSIKFQYILLDKKKENGKRRMELNKILENHCLVKEK